MQEIIEKAEIEKKTAVYFEKAKQLDKLPIKVDEVAKHLAVLEKAGAETATFIFDLLKAVNNIAKDGDLFVERGTSVAEKDFVEKAEALIKAGKKGEIRKLLLEMSPDEQAAVVAENRQKITQGRK
jgi:hypothetical protein